MYLEMTDIRIEHGPDRGNEYKMAVLSLCTRGHQKECTEMSRLTCNDLLLLLLLHGFEFTILAFSFYEG